MRYTTPVATAVALALVTAVALRVGIAGPETAPPPFSAAPPPSDGGAAPETQEPEEVPPVRRATSWRSPTQAPLARVAEAEAAKLPIVKGLFAAANVAFPPSQLLLRAFKKERRLEMWAATRAGEPLTHVTTYEICRLSGALGPKRQEGDGQTPEGFYTLSDYNPASSFHLAMLVSYPNLSDRILGDQRHPGNEIMIHGNCVSIGCLAMSDERIQELWLATTALRYAGGVVHVHVFPTRDMAGLVAATPEGELRAFWQNLEEGFDFFKSRRRLPHVRVDAVGRYHFL